MFRYESEMIPILVNKISERFQTPYIVTEFSTGNGVADIVFTTDLSNENLFFRDYGLLALFINYFSGKESIDVTKLEKTAPNKTRLKKLIKLLEVEEYIRYEGSNILQKRSYVPHAQNLISIEAKLNDWKSGFYQALRYKFFSNQSYLAYPKAQIHRVDISLLKEHSIGLIAVDQDSIDFIIKPRNKKPEDKISYLFLAEMFATPFKSRQCTSIKRGLNI